MGVETRRPRISPIPDWENEGYEKKPYTGGSTIEDDNGDLNSYSKIFDDVVE